MSLTEVFQYLSKDDILKIIPSKSLHNVYKTSKNIKNMLEENKIKISTHVKLSKTNKKNNEQDLCEILKISSRFNVVEIYIDNCYKIKKNDAIYLAEIIKNNTELEYFSMIRCGIDPYIANILLLALANCHKLIQINLDYNTIDAENPYFEKFIEDITTCFNFNEINLDLNILSNNIYKYNNLFVLNNKFIFKYIIR